MCVCVCVCVSRLYRPRALTCFLGLQHPDGGSVLLAVREEGVVQRSQRRRKTQVSGRQVERGHGQYDNAPLAGYTQSLATSTDKAGDLEETWRRLGGGLKETWRRLEGGLKETWRRLGRDVKET